MYDPLALDRQRVEQDRLRNNAEASSRRPARKPSPKRSRTGLFATVVALVPHPRSSGEGCSEATRALAPM